MDKLTLERMANAIKDKLDYSGFNYSKNEWLEAAKAAFEAEHSNKDSAPCATCGKPMEDRGAITQWCAECSSKHPLPIYCEHNISPKSDCYKCHIISSRESTMQESGQKPDSHQE